MKIRSAAQGIAIIFISIILLFGFNSAAASNTMANGALYIFAHQDDEVGVAARMAYQVRAGIPVEVVWITDGAASTPADVREKEARAAMKQIGVPEKSLHFLKYPDNGSYRYMEQILNDVMKIAEKINPSEIMSIAYEGGNIDHDLTSLEATLVAKGLPAKPVHYEYPLYSTYGGSYRTGKFIPKEGAETLYTPLDDELMELKIKVLDNYPSQAAILNMLKAMFNKKSLKKGEQYRVAPDYDYMKSPTVGRVGYEVATRHPVTFEKWLQYAKPFIEHESADWIREQ